MTAESGFHSALSSYAFYLSHACHEPVALADPTILHLDILGFFIFALASWSMVKGK